MAEKRQLRPAKPGNSGSLRRQRPGTPDVRPITCPAAGFSYTDGAIGPQIKATGGNCGNPPGHTHIVPPPKTRGTGKPPAELDRAPNGSNNQNGGLIPMCRRIPIAQLHHGVNQCKNPESL